MLVRHAVWITWALLAIVGCSQTAKPPPAEAVAATTRAKSPEPPPGVLFDGTSLAGWTVLTDGPFSGRADVAVKDGTIVLSSGKPQTGISWKGAFPRENYEVALEAKRVEGSDFFCGMTFPVGEEPCTLICGGWGGCVVGLSNVDGMHAAENITTGGMNFEQDRWYRIRLRVTRGHISAWIDEQQVVDLERATHRFSVWAEQEPVRPFGVSTWYTGAALRDIRVRQIE